MTQWLARAPGGQPVEVLEADVRPGGKWRINAIAPNNTVYRLQGTYKEVKRPERLAFTWHWEGADFADSLVTIELRRLGTSNFTELTITHDLLPEKWREDHKKGWTACFELLDALLKTTQE